MSPETVLASVRAASFPTPHFPDLKTRWKEWDLVPGESPSAPSFLPGMYTCHFGAVPEDEKALPVRSWAVYGSGVNLPSRLGSFHSAQLRV